MKIALCFSGLIGGLKGKNFERMEGNIKSLKISSESIKKHILDKNDVDIFIFGWETELLNDMIKTYNPKKVHFTPQITFKTPPHLPDNIRVQSHYSRWYGNKVVMGFKQGYEKEHSFTYDCVMVSRFDTIWYTDVDFSVFDMNYYHIPKLTFKGQKQQYGWPAQLPEVIDHFMFSNSKNMDNFYNLYDKLDEYTVPGQSPSWRSISSHFLIVWHFRKLALLNKIKFPFTHCDYRSDLNKPFDYTFVRHHDMITNYFKGIK